MKGEPHTAQPPVTVTNPEGPAKRRPRGNALLFTVVFGIPFLLIMAGFAIDVGFLTTVRSELHRSMDAAALAGAGALGFNDTVFPTARANAVTYGALNPTHVGPVTLDSNAGNSAGGDIVLGVWNGLTGQFTPSVDGTYVNAVLCRKTANVPTSFLRLIGLTSYPMFAQSIAVANPPSAPPEGTCVFPIGVSDCPFRDGSMYGSQGCGAVISFINANANTAGWVDLNSSSTPGGAQTPSANTTRDAVNQAAAGGCTSAPPPLSWIGTQGGMDQSVFDPISRCNPGTGTDCAGLFNSHLTPDHTTTNASSTVTYSGPGWEVYVPIIHSTECPPGNINQPHQIMNYARIVIVQVINRGWCGVANHYPGNAWDGLCPPPNGTSTLPRDSNLRAIYAYYDCTWWDSTSVVVPAPKAALATKLRLVQ